MPPDWDLMATDRLNLFAHVSLEGGALRRRWKALLAALITGWVFLNAPFATTTAIAQPSLFGVSEPDLIERDLPVFETDALRLYFSPAAKAEARRLAKVMSSAVHWYRSRLAWSEPIAVAVLGQEDWQAITPIPYPTPFASMRWDVVVMPDSIREFPGFGQWGFRERALNEALTFHELGHIIANQLGIRSGNHFVEELIANVFLAAYVRARRPDLAFILDGVPEGFGNGFTHRHLVDLDDLYAGVGLDNYAWFQFHLAAIADDMVTSVPLTELVRGLHQAFPRETMTRRETTSAALARLEAIAPGVARLAAPLMGAGVLPVLATGPCDVGRETAGGDPQTLFIDNRTSGVVRYRIPSQLRDYIALNLSLEIDLAATYDAAFEALVEAAFQEAMASADSFETLPAGQVVRYSLAPGTLIETSAACATMAGEPARLLFE